MSFKVAIKFRNLTPREEETNKLWNISGNSITNKVNGKIFEFDKVFGESATTSEMFDNLIVPKIKEIINGLNLMVAAYSQPGSGKTFTMSLNRNDLIQKTCEFLFGFFLDKPEFQFQVKISYIEIYLDKYLDLLQENDQGINLEIKTNLEGKIFIKNLITRLVTSQEEVLQCLKDGEKRRHTAPTNLNPKSSRSHTLFELAIDIIRCSTETTVTSKITFLDMAGHERLMKTGAQGKTLMEANAINESLLSFGNVLKQIAVNPKGYVPFRGNCLTRLLQKYIDGSCNIFLLCMVSPLDIEETERTLRFAQNVKGIKLQSICMQDNRSQAQQHVAELKVQLALANKTIEAKEKLEKELREQISELRLCCSVQEDAPRENMLQSKRNYASSSGISLPSTIEFKNNNFVVKDEAVVFLDDDDDDDVFLIDCSLAKLGQSGQMGSKSTPARLLWAKRNGHKESSSSRPYATGFVLPENETLAVAPPTSDKMCSNCNTKETQQWRRHELTNALLCQRCGAYRDRTHSDRPQHLWNAPLRTRRH